MVVDENIPPFGYEPLGYLIRILSYLFIIAGILYKNTVANSATIPASRPPTAVPQESLL